MKRKVNKVGTSTLTVSLPSKWAKNIGLKVGDEIEVEEDGSLLRISTHLSKEIKKTKIHLKDENSDVLGSIFGGLYRDGYDEIEISSDSYEPLLELQSRLDIMPGFEYFEINKRRAIIRNVVSGMTLNLHEGISKMRHILNVMHDLIIESINENKFERYDEIKKLRESGLRYRNLVSRIILKDYRVNNSVLPYYTIAFVLAAIPGNYRVIYKWLSKTKPKISKENIDFLISVNARLNDLLSGQKNPSLIHSEIRELEATAFSLMSEKKAEIFMISTALAISRQIQSMNASFMMVKMNKET